jgi:hypothetical protein
MHISSNIQISCQQSVNLYAHVISKNLLPQAFPPSEKVKVLYHFFPKFFPSYPRTENDPSNTLYLLGQEIVASISPPSI